MRLKRLVVFSGIVLLCTGQSLFAQSKQERKEKKEKAVKEVVDSGRIKIDVDRAVPMAGRSVNLTTPYSLEIHGDSILSHLPYFGRAYSAPYGGGEGLMFKEVAVEKERTSKKKGRSEIKFRVKTKEDIYTFRVEVYPNGSATINVTPVNKQSITFYGDVALDLK
ncbi:DUF4251 domain-containing protein [uncultured Parabacteroides sp.]|uniref:DUF4251 domain-containing protein n=1 Tax=uncultured Parabacteroides sp. TaxID=512312 RepID=UPI00260A3E2E|nr:DUF4251 domain-containing protein [uncultured Parabacteroides sp.]